MKQQGCDNLNANTPIYSTLTNFLPNVTRTKTQAGEHAASTCQHRALGITRTAAFKGWSEAIYNSLSPTEAASYAISANKCLDFTSRAVEKLK